jgi:lipid-binding SYLF domain-containing protein
MKRTVGALLAFSLFLLFLNVSPAKADTKTDEKIQDSITVLKEIMSIPEKSIPPALLDNASGIAIIPGVIKAGFILGGRYGTGVLLVRNEERAWSDPSFISLAGGSIGWQAGVESIDIILVFKSSRSIERIRTGRFTLGADASIAAGPVGRQASAGTDIQLKSEIYSYSRSRGLFAGLSLEGASMQIDEEDNEVYYGRAGRFVENIFEGKDIKTPPGAEKLKELLTHYTGGKKD